MDKNLSASIAIRNKNNVWINDSVVNKCSSCKIEFGLFLRKHHCRNCGNIFCYTCSNFYTVIPKFITDKPNPADYWNLSHYVKVLRGKHERVCEQCFLIIEEKTQNYEKIINTINN